MNLDNPTTNEWTAAGEVLATLSEKQAKIIIDAHKAALRHAQPFLDDALKQLAYERELNKALPKAVDELREQLSAAVEAGREALVALATLKITDDEKPYVEISPDLRNQIRKSHDLLFAALAKIGK